MLTISFSVFSQDSSNVTVSFGELQQADPIDTGLVYNSMFVEYQDFDTTNIVSIQIEVIDVSNNNKLVSRNIVRLPEDSDIKYTIVEGVLKVNMGYYLPQNQYKIIYRTEDYQGILSDLKEINLSYE
ncbi:MAG: hypothetical protein COA32_13665 [Fluviicola sp.]|nr:MAG: hypothetical protein COA32_13665 [Fluviicola sp.]